LLTTINYWINQFLFGKKRHIKIMMKYKKNNFCM
jgi:predicted RNA-binding protein associated with RNAse of E/G family